MMYLKYVGGILVMCLVVTVFFTLVSEYQTRKEEKDE